ncbi:caspase family protein [Candidatus Obscuribacterales bacterium]|nr:caspase family protein [Candidatus Obscuribacterales bacterium]
MHGVITTHATSACEHFRTEQFKTNYYLNYLITIVKGNSESSAALYMVSIGVNDYEDPKMPDQKYAVRDAEEFANALSKRAVKLFRQIDVCVLRDSTPSDIEAAVNRVVKLANPQDTFVIFYAGAGTQILLKTGIDGKPFKSGYDSQTVTEEEMSELDTILPTSTISNRYDRTNVLENSITGRKLAALCSRVLANQQLIVMDSCYSGASIPKIKDLLLTKPDLDGLGRKLAVIGLAGNSFEPPALDKHGALTKAILDGLDGAADSNKNGQISVSELQDYAELHLPEICADLSDISTKPTVAKFMHGGDFTITQSEGVTTGSATMTRGGGTRDISRVALATKSIPVSSKGYAVFFATDQYTDKSIDTLTNPIHDAEQIANLLTSKYGWNCKVQKNPTVSQIRETLKEYSQYALEPDSELLIYFAGHGTYDPDLRQGFIAASDSKSGGLESTWFSHSDLVRYVTARLEKWPHTLLVIDACFSGTLAQSFAHEVVVSDFRRAGNPQVPPIPEGKTLYQDFSVSDYYNHIFIPRKTLWFIVSGTGPVQDGKKFEHSPFARKLIDVLQKPDVTGKGFLTRRDIEAGIEMVRSGPISADIPGVDVGGPFVFVPSTIGGSNPSSVRTPITTNGQGKR